MAIIAKANPTYEKNLISPGSHVAICYQVIDLGNQKKDYQGKPKIIRKLRLMFELPNETKEFIPGEGKKPYVIGKEYTLSLSEKANLRKDLENWRSKLFTKKELEGFDIERLLGKACLVQVIHKQGKNGDYASISGISSVPKGTQLPQKPFNDAFCLSLDEFDQAKFDKLPEYIKEKILNSQEAKEGFLKPKSEAEHVSDDIF